MPSSPSCPQPSFCLLSLEVCYGSRGGFVPGKKDLLRAHAAQKSRLFSFSALPMPVLRRAGTWTRCFHWPVRGWHPRGVFLSGKNLSLCLGIGTTSVGAEARFFQPRPLQDSGFPAVVVQGRGKLPPSFHAALGCRTHLNRVSPPSHSQVRLCFHFQRRQIREFAFKASLTRAELLHRASPRASGRENHSSLGFRRRSFIPPSTLSREEKFAAIPGSQVCMERGHSWISPTNAGQCAELVGVKVLRDWDIILIQKKDLIVHYPRRTEPSSCVSCCVTQFPCC